jgi:hypothetical protein
MSENPYNPPKSEVRDSPSVRAIAERPRQILLYAVALLWVSLALGIPTAIYDYKKASTEAFAPFVLVVMILVYALGICLNIFVARGHNWARIVLLIFTGVTILSFIGYIEEYLQDPMVYVVLNALTIVMDGVALYLLFSRPGALWFRHVE